MKVSVVVTNYNYDKWLRRCIRSLLNQNFNDYEIIIADDYVNNSFVNTLYLCVSLNNHDAVACDYQEVDFKENVLSTKSQKDEPLACGIIYRTDILEYLNFWNANLRINEDIDMIKRFKKKFKIKYLNIPLYRYFKHDNSLSVGR
jgi:hypothetical protein